MHYYNEWDKYAAQWLRNLISGGHIPNGDVDERSIADVSAGDLAGYTQCHFFAGIGGWPLALRIAGWPDDRPVWTGSCPCQPFSVAGKGEGTADERHLWPAWFSLIAKCRPATVFGEQVDAAIKHGWLDSVFADMEAEGYACGATVLPACSVGAPHIRKRLWFVADRAGGGSCRRTTGTDRRPTEISQRLCGAVTLADAGCGSIQHERFELSGTAGENKGERYQRQRLRPDFGNGVATGEFGDAAGAGLEGPAGPCLQRRSDGLAGAGPWSDVEWLPCADGKARPTKPGIFPLANGVPDRVGKLRAAGNAIVPQVAAEFIGAFL